MLKLRHKHFSYGAMTVGTLIGAFVFQLILLLQLGVGAQLDAFIASCTLPQFVSVVLATCMASVLVPRYAGQRMDKQSAEAWSLIRTLFPYGVVGALLLTIGRATWLPLVFSGFSAEALANCIYLSGWMLFTIPSALVFSIATSVLQARRQFFAVAALTGFPVLLSLPVLYFMLPKFGVQVAAWIQVIVSISQMFAVLWMLGKPILYTYGNREKVLVRIFWRKSKPLLLGNTYLKSDLIVDRYLLASGQPGDIALFALARQLLDAGSTLVSRVFSVTAVPDLAMAVKCRDQAGFIAIYKYRIRVLFFISVFVFVFILACFLFGNSIENVMGVYYLKVYFLFKLLLLLSGTFVFGVLGGFVSSSFYAIGDTKTPTFLSVISLTVFFLVKLFIFPLYGIFGLSIVISSYYAINFIIMIYILPVKLSKVINV